MPCHATPVPPSLGGDTTSSIRVRYSQGEVVQGASDLREHPPPLAVEHTAVAVVLVVIVVLVSSMLLLLLLQLPPLARERFEPPHLHRVFFFFRFPEN